MKKRGLTISILLLLGFGWSSAAADESICSFSIDSLKVENSYNYRYPGLENVNVNSDFSIPVKTIYFESVLGLSVEDFFVESYDQEFIGHASPDKIKFEDRITGYENIAPELLQNSKTLRSPIYNIENMKRNGIAYTAVSVLPVTIDVKGNLIFNNSIRLKESAFGQIYNKSELLINEPVSSTREISFSAEKSSSVYGLPLGYEYVIITTIDLAESFEALVDFKNATGISTAVALVDSIYAHYTGLDEVEQIREYLKDFHQSGGEYVLLGGDNVILPVRYVYYYNTNTPPSDPYYLMPSDLYYADLSGDWDADKDGIWGEPNDDAPDIYPELIVGRLPVRNQSAVTNYINKLITYATNPGNGDFNYLNKSLFFSSDEMRDYPSEGQHCLIAGGLPEYFEVDTVTGVEFPTGFDANPTNALGENGVDKISEGFGFVHIIAHGRIDGFVVRSANYGDWPASFILTQPQVGSHGSIDSLEQNNKSSLYYSLACNVGGFDLDSADGKPGEFSLVEKLISKENSGAVGMVANSRWGWVYSSYYLQQAFTEYLYNEAEGNPAVAMYNSWLDYPYYRDLIYGQNFFGDPTMNIYTDIPEQLESTVSDSKQNYQVNFSSNDQPISDVGVTLSLDGAVLEAGNTDLNGNYTFATELEDDLEYMITAVKNGYTVAQKCYCPSLALDVDDDEENLLPREFSLKQNYPNPFNPTTHIDYTLPRKSDIALEIYNILGQAVKTIEVQSQAPGRHSITWDGTDDYNANVASGIYFYRLSTGEFTQTRKMVLIR